MAFKKGQTPWNKGLKGYRAGIPKSWKKASGEDSPTWKGINVGYRGLHLWVQKELGTPENCEHCGKHGTGHRMHWANISCEYRREKSDWVRLCPACHGIFDSTKRGIRNIEKGL